MSQGDIWCCLVVLCVSLQLRAKYGFEQAAYQDCAAVFLCPCCTTCQDAREIKRRQASQPEELMMG